MIKQLFRNLGVEEKESKVYLAALETGSSPVSLIAAKAKLNRVTTYGILEKLIKKGMVNFIARRKIKYFHAVDPEILFVDYQKNLHDFKKALPDLKRMFGQTPHPKINYFEGLDGIKKIYADTLTSLTDILNYCNSREIREFWPGYDKEYVAERTRRKIYLRGIAPDDEYGRKVRTADPEMRREIRLIPKDKYNFRNDINIYDNKVAIISFAHEPIGMIIESSEIADTQRAIFETVWDFAENFLALGPVI